MRVAASDFEGPDGTLDVTAFRDLWEGWLEPFMNALDKVHLAWAVPSPHIIHMCSRVRMCARGCLAAGQSFAVLLSSPVAMLRRQEACVCLALRP